ncbi:uncharacterized protein LOC18429241 [Amborella trichopoda]|uniref:ATPase, vacuolar ER assembly factor, Vma12 n=1 Tax=Amborella trichopoda TaxID=13333 RepID=W1NZS9_AMBTC|nr:uncharacterized protein LOC18429241 [Amborella trichopoda]ERN01163.1 hypothetical protein AMTR_s00002p00221840 [Amborella trichopoda]|eukprot:XP_006838594.1 uncharacterized protein LOC18429241 [Amborella trichopoda]
MEGSKGLVIKSNKTLISFLLDASQLQTLSADLRTVAEDLSSKDSIPYKTLKDLWLSMPCSERPSLLSLLFSSEFLLQSPKPREKSEELKERLRKLAEDAEKKAYDDLIKDIAPKKQEEPFSSYRDQIGFGLHVIVTMFTGFLVGYAGFRALFGRSAIMSAAGGIFGLVSAMLLETVLFIIRASGQDIGSSASASSSSSTSLKLKKKQ